MRKKKVDYNKFQTFLNETPKLWYCELVTRALARHLRVSLILFQQKDLKMAYFTLNLYVIVCLRNKTEK